MKTIRQAGELLTTRQWRGGVGAASGTPGLALAAGRRSGSPHDSDGEPQAGRAGQQPKQQVSRDRSSSRHQQPARRASATAAAVRKGGGGAKRLKAPGPDQVADPPTGLASGGEGGGGDEGGSGSGSGSELDVPLAFRRSRAAADADGGGRSARKRHHQDALEAFTRRREERGARGQPRRKLRRRGEAAAPRAGGGPAGDLEDREADQIMDSISDQMEEEEDEDSGSEMEEEAAAAEEQPPVARRSERTAAAARKRAAGGGRGAVRGRGAVSDEEGSGSESDGDWNSGAESSDDYAQDSG